jgi:hypothetical protein
MEPIMRGSARKNAVAFAVFLIFLLYLGLIIFKTSVSFGDNELTFSGQSPILACGPDCMEVAHGLLYYGTFDLIRTASVSLLIGLFMGLCLLNGSTRPRRGFAVAMLICGPIVVFSAVLGEVQMVVRLLLVAIGVFATVDGASTLRRGAEGEQAGS